MMQWGQQHNVREDDNFESYVAEIFDDYKEWDIIKATIDLDLAANPKIGTLIGEISSKRYLYGIRIPWYPEVILYYIVDDNQNSLVLYELAWA